MSAASTPQARTPRKRSVPRAGWMVVAAKEFGDHLLSIRFAVLLIIVAIAAAVPLYFLSGLIRQAAEQATDVPALFIGLFWQAPPVNAADPNSTTLPSVVGFLALVGPLLGLTFAFDAVNGERAGGTLPRLLSQPIHRDDVVNGKFAAGLAVIALVLVSMVGAITAFALIRLGIVPNAVEVLRLFIWLLVTFVYVSLWLAFGMLLSVVVRGAASSALIGFGVWFLLSVFGPLIVSLVAGFLSPIAGTPDQQLQGAATQQTLFRLLPDTLYREASLTLLNPQVTSVSTPATLGSYEQAQQRVASLLSLDQSFILVWPQVVGLVAMTVACFAVAYVLFMRQEVRA